VAQSAGDDDARENAMTALGTHLRDGVDADASWDAAPLLADRRQRRTEQAIAAQQRREQAINARDLVLVLGEVVSIIADEAPDAATAARVLDRIEREVMSGPQRVEKRADKPWLN
jgi:hypothetical protein